jgi:hypothetical protein
VLGFRRVRQMVSVGENGHHEGDANRALFLLRLLCVEKP